jgi:hypothetical protein
MTTQISVDELVDVLEPLIRRVVREELAQLVEKEPDFFYLPEDSPLYQDMKEILERREKGQIKLYSHQEVWGE